MGGGVVGDGIEGFAEGGGVAGGRIIVGGASDFRVANGSRGLRGGTHGVCGSMPLVDVVLLPPPIWGAWSEAHLTIMLHKLRTRLVANAHLGMHMGAQLSLFSDSHGEAPPPTCAPARTAASSFVLVESNVTRDLLPAGKASKVR